MKKELIVRAWKDPVFRATLSPEQRAALPDNPSGRSLTELEEDQLLGITGGMKPISLEPTTGCTGPVRHTCGIINCTLLQDF